MNNNHGNVEKGLRPSLKVVLITQTVPGTVSTVPGTVTQNTNLGNVPTSLREVLINLGRERNNYTSN